MIRQLPFFEKATGVDVAGESVPVYPFQIVLWVSLRVRGVLSPRFPALLDTGMSMTFSIADGLLRRWSRSAAGGSQ